MNEKRETAGLGAVSVDTLELLMDRLEKESYFQVRKPPIDLETHKTGFCEVYTYKLIRVNLFVRLLQMDSLVPMLSLTMMLCAVSVWMVNVRILTSFCSVICVIWLYIRIVMVCLIFQKVM